MTLTIFTLVLAALTGAILSRLYHRHYRSEIRERDRQIKELTCLLNNQNIYISELQHRCQRAKRTEPARPSFSDYAQRNGNMVYLYRVHWNQE